MKNKLRLTLLAIGFIALTTPSMNCLAAKWETFHVKILSTGDIHEHARKLGRIERFIDKERKQKGQITIVVDTGDLLEHRKSLSNKHHGILCLPNKEQGKGDEIFDWAKKINYDAMLLGNHDLCGGIKKAVTQRLPYIGVNSSLDIKKYKIITKNLPGRQQIKIGIIGFMDECQKDYHFNSKKDKAKFKAYPVSSGTSKGFLDKMLKHKCDLYVFLSHNWNLCIDKKIAPMPGAWIICNGHTHDKFAKSLKIKGKKFKRYIVSQGSGGKYVGVTTATFSRPSKKQSWKLWKVKNKTKRMVSKKK